MYVCKNCGSVFSTPAYNKHKSECPDCGSTNFTEAKYCKTCHEYFVGAPNEEYCPDCVYNAEEQLRRAVEKWVDNDYIELLKDEYTDLEYILGGEE